VRPSSRALPPGRAPRAGADHTAPRRPPRRLPMRVVETPTTADAPAPAEETSHRPRWRRLGKVIAVVALLLLLAECAVIVRGLRAEDSEPDAVPALPVPLSPPDALPAEGAFVRSEVRADGSIAVTHWIRAADDIDELTLAAPAPTDGSGSVRAVDARVVAADGTVQADDLTIDAEIRRVRLKQPTRLLRATYVLRGAVDRSSTVDGRLRALAVSLEVDAAETGPAVVLVTGAGEVLNLACANARSGVELLRPCGSPDGAGWRVRLPAERSADRVVAQVDVP
jgi:hypothetical protein